MRLRTLAAILLAAAGAVASTAGAKPAPNAGLIAKVTEAMRLEARALGLYTQDPTNTEATELARRSAELLREVADKLRNKPGSSSPLRFLDSAIGADARFVREQADGQKAEGIAALRIALESKWEAIGYLENPMWIPTPPAGAKAPPPTRVKAPACRSLAGGAPPVFGCSQVDTWDVFVDPSARAARCLFNGPRGALAPGKRLFSNTMQFTSCTFAGLTTVKGERKRIVRAELRVVVSEGDRASGEAIVRVRVLWQ